MNEDGECFNTVVNRRKDKERINQMEKKEEQRKKKEEEEVKRKEEEERKRKEEDELRKKRETECRHFLSGNCRHGFKGTKEVGNTKQCPYLHPKVCRKFLRNGSKEGGCDIGSNCSFKHPKMCPDSIRDSQCPLMKPGSRCTRGYHLSGTTSTTNVLSSMACGQTSSSRVPIGYNIPSASNVPPVSAAPTVPTVAASSQTQGTNGDMRSILERIMREEVRAIIRGMMPAPP